MIRTRTKLVLFLIPCAFGQTAAPQGPTLGFAFDGAAEALRTIIGLPGAAHFSDPSTGGVRFSSVALSPRQNFGLGIGAYDSLPYVIQLTGTRKTTPLPGINWLPSKIAISPSGAAAVLVGPSGSVELVSGLPDSPALTGEIDLSAIAGTLQAIAIADNGIVLAAFAEGDASRVYAIRGGTGAQLMGTAQKVSAINFLTNSTSALVADEAARQILFYKVSDSGAAVSIIASEADGINDPVAVNASGSGRWAVAGNGADRTIVRIDLSGATAPAKFRCSCEPLNITRLAGEAIFQLGDLGDQPLWIFDGDDADPRVVFVPAPRVRNPHRGGR